MERLELKNGWKLTFAQNSEVKACGFDPKTCEEAKNSSFTQIEAEVPSCFERELYRNGICGDPFYSDNIFSMRKYEGCHQLYYTHFDCPFKNAQITFEGIDTVADIFVNGKKVGSVENMFLAHTFALENVREKHNDLVVHIYPASIAARKYPLEPSLFAHRYNHAMLPLRKSAGSFGWDILPRIVCGGIWREVYLEERKPERFTQEYLYTAKTDGTTAFLNLFYTFETDADDLSDYEIRVYGKCGDDEIVATEKPWHTAGTFMIEKRNAKFWNPRGYGEQNLYDMRVSLVKSGVAVDEKRYRFGIRTVELIRTPQAVPNGKFEFWVNGKKVFITGTNWVLTDSMHGEDKMRRRKGLEYARELGCNMIRVWGGATYECDEFYEYCDEHGILVWQDFMMACAVYPDDERMIALFKQEAETVVRRLREHASLAVWAGDNECDMAYQWINLGRDPFRNRLTREILPEVVRRCDVRRPYIASSPCLEPETFGNMRNMAENHLWNWRVHFKAPYYAEAPTLFASETGYYAFPSPATLRTYLKEPEKFYEENGELTKEYFAHSASMCPDEKDPYGYRTKAALEQAKRLFTEDLTDMTDIARGSQISQAEALKFFIERFRIRRNTHGGLLWWNILDGWPQVSDAVVDYYLRKKLSYHYIKRSQRPVCLMGEEQSGKLCIYGVNDTPKAVKISYKITNLETDRVLSAGDAVLNEYASALVCGLDIPEGEQAFCLIEWTEGAGKTYSNHFYTNLTKIGYRKYLAAQKKAGYDDYEGFEGE